MKKIIATVLAMVMALALCTTAFADTTTKTLDYSDYKLIDMDNQPVSGMPEKATLVYHAESTSTVTKDGKTTVTVSPAYYELKAEGATKSVYGVVVAAENATAKLVAVADNKIVDYVYYADVANFDIDKIKASDVVTKAIAGVKKADAKCGDYVGENVTFYVIDGKVYQACAYEVSDSVKLALLNGKIVAYKAFTATEELGLKEHKFTANSKTNKTDGTITSILCENCEKYIPVVTKVPADSTDLYIKVTAFSDGTTKYFYKADATGTDSGATTTPSTGNTTSPKTFDAGIAMYVGMALTSVAGSAVVIGKKKEF